MLFNFRAFLPLVYFTLWLPRWLSGKELPVNADFLIWEDPLGEEIATHSSILAWEIPWIDESGGLQSMGSQRVGQD